MVQLQMEDLLHVSLLASGRIEEIGSGFQASGSSPGAVPWVTILFFACFLVAIVSAIGLFQYQRSFLPPFKPDKHGILLHLAYRHRLDRNQLRLLQQVSKQRGPTPTAKLFLSPDAFEQILREDYRPAAELAELRKIYDKIFRQTPAR